jgi:ribosomal protein S18 acetylase RimI-like enzyme
MLRSPISSTREMKFREITIRDIPALFDVRTAVRENAFTREGLYSAGITEPAVENMLRTSHRSWLCECDSEVVGFATANRETAEFWVIAVLPEYEGRGIGGKRISRVVAGEIPQQRAQWLAG